MLNYESDSDNDSNYEDSFYNAEEVSKTKYNVALCELYNRSIHGIPPLNSDVDKHYLLIYRFKTFNNNLFRILSNDIRTAYAYLEDQTHPIVKNYKYMMCQPDYIKPEIVEGLYLEGDEFVAIIKTFWIRLIQRKWKNIYKERQTILKQRCIARSIMYRELRGIWPPECLYYPSLRGMLSSIG